MKNRKNTKRALISSVFMMLLCCIMLMGTTFAWFTDSSSTAVNKVVSGTLDVQLVDAQGKELDPTTPLQFVTADGRTENILWEPGATYYLPAIAVKNNGNLALKFTVSFEGVTGDAKLLEAIEWSALIGNETIDLANGYEWHLSAGQTSEAITLTGHMKEESGNQYMGLTLEGIGITVAATQWTEEYDSTTNQYDANASYPIINGSAGDIADAAVNGGTIVVNEPVASVNATVAQDKTLNVELNSDMTAEAGQTPFTNEGTLVLSGEGTLSSEVQLVTNTGNATISDIEMTSSGNVYPVNTEDDGVTVLNDVTLYGERGALRAVNGAHVIFNSGSVTVDGFGGSVGHVVYAYGEGTLVEINGGTFKHNRNCTKGAIIYADAGAEVVIMDGSFTKGPNGYKGKWIQANGGASVTIYGGRFQFDPSAFVASGYTAVEGTDGWWTVTAE